MATIISKGSSKKEIKKKLEKHRKSTPKKELRKYCGILALSEDPIELQKKWRNEWQ